MGSAGADLAGGHSRGPTLAGSGSTTAQLGPGRLSQQRSRPWPGPWPAARRRLAGLGAPARSLPKDSAPGLPGERHRDGRRGRHAPTGLLGAGPVAWTAAVGCGHLGTEPGGPALRPAGGGPAELGAGPGRTAGGLHPRSRPRRLHHPGPCPAGPLANRQPPGRGTLGPGPGGSASDRGGGAGETERPAGAYAAEPLGRDPGVTQPSAESAGAGGPADCDRPGPALAAPQLDHHPGGHQPGRDRIRRQRRGSPRAEPGLPALVPAAVAQPAGDRAADPGPRRGPDGGLAAPPAAGRLAASSSAGPAAGLGLADRLHPGQLVVHHPEPQQGWALHRAGAAPAHAAAGQGLVADRPLAPGPPRSVRGRARGWSPGLRPAGGSRGAGHHPGQGPAAGGTLSRSRSHG